MKKIILGLFLLVGMQSIKAQSWIERMDTIPNFDLRGFKVMVVLGDEFDYYEALYIPNLWAKWGATVYYAGSESNLTGFLTQKKGDEFVVGQKRNLIPDILIREAFPDGYHLIYVPGGKSAENLLEKERMAKMTKKVITDAHKQEKLIASMSEGAYLLAESGVLFDRYFVSPKNMIKACEAKGGIFQDAKSVGHKNILTGKWPYFDHFAVECAKYLERLKSVPTE